MTMIIKKGDLLTAGEEFILQQNNCIGCKPHGLSAAIALRFPYANPYAARRPIGKRNMAMEEDRPEPGTIKVFRPPDDVGDSVACGATGKLPTFVSMFAQYGMGKPFAYNNGGPDAHPDDFALRHQWFQRCLYAVADLQPKSVALPYNIGCGLAQGDWLTYEGIIRSWADSHPEIAV